MFSKYGANASSFTSRVSSPSPKADCHGIVLCLVGSHAYTEAGVPACCTFHHDDFNLLVHALIVHVLEAAVVK